jgi:hypothetical protein
MSIYLKLIKTPIIRQINNRYLINCTINRFHNFTKLNNINKFDLSNITESGNNTSVKDYADDVMTEEEESKLLLSLKKNQVNR